MDATKQLFAVVENYPQLKASANFLALQRELVDTEDRIAAARRFYNANVARLQRQPHDVPRRCWSRGFGDFPPQDYFEVDDHTVPPRPPVVSFDGQAWRGERQDATVARDE